MYLLAIIFNIFKKIGNGTVIAVTCNKCCSIFHRLRSLPADCRNADALYHIIVVEIVSDSTRMLMRNTKHICYFKHRG